MSVRWRVGAASGLVALGAALLALALHMGRPEQGPRDSSPGDPVRAAMERLAAQHFPPITAIDRASFNRLASWAKNPQLCRGATVIVQAVDGAVYVDLDGWASPYAWDKMRVQFLLEELRLLLKRRPGLALEFVLVRPRPPHRP